jgi:hypothetical protein
MNIKDFLPQNKKEWLKFCLDIIILIVFLIFVFLHSYSYREGFNKALEICKNNCFCPFNLP